MAPLERKRRANALAIRRELECRDLLEAGEPLDGYQAAGTGIEPIDAAARNPRRARHHAERRASGIAQPGNADPLIVRDVQVLLRGIERDSVRIAEHVVAAMHAFEC